jgi:2,5-diketo-D-gluconate reductase A
MEISKSTRNEIDMPLVGFGTYQLSIDQAEFCVNEALKAGFRHIDSAEGYNNEEGTGKGIKAAGVYRDDIFVTTKLFPGYKQWGAPEKTYEQTIETLKNQLKQLQLDYVDLYLIHAPLSELRLEQWNAFVELKKSGLTRHIGVSNYNEERLKEVLDADLAKPEANQVERYKGNYRVRSFTCFDQFLCMAFAQLTYRDSLRGIECCLRAMKDK